jgi:transposase InsO family protein
LRFYLDERKRYSSPEEKKRVPVTTDSRHDFRIAPNLLKRDFNACTPDRIWLADITYVPTDEGWLYLGAIKGGQPGKSSVGAWTTI